MSRPNWSRKLPRPLKIPTVMTLTTLADMRELVERHLPTECRERDTWRHVLAQMNEAARGVRNQCFAVAIDPKNATPGVGWSIAENLAKAEEQAIAQCRTTAGADRQQFCVVMKERGVNEGCDGTAK